jgi:hypothetical protein
MLRIRAVLDLKHRLPWKLGTWSLDVDKYTSKERKKKRKKKERKKEHLFYQQHRTGLIIDEKKTIIRLSLKLQSIRL